MTLRTVALLAVVASLVLAGCTGGPLGNPAADGDGSGETGRMNFYVSDEANAIDDFSSLNVTITKVGFHKGGENGTWIERDVDNRTVDLTELKGERATKLAAFDLPNGTYTKVFAYVSETNGTLSETGEQVDVKLPSEKLHINKPFVLENGSEVDFVFDISVHKAGNSGKYILKPVIGESGTDVPIDDVDAADDDEEMDDDADLQAVFVGNVTRGEDATVEVTRNGSAVANATVTVNGEELGTTDADGRFTFTVPENATDLEVTITDGDDETELEREFDDEEESTEEGEPEESPEPASTPTATETATTTG